MYYIPYNTLIKVYVLIVHISEFKYNYLKIHIGVL